MQMNISYLPIKIKVSMEELMYIQSKIHAPKDSVNQYGKYKYRKAEQILEAVKPLLEEKKCTLVVSDDIVLVGSNVYVKSTSTLTNNSGESVYAVGWAREADSLAGMSPGQVTGATSSYARKYSLCGLFAIDDTKDLDDDSVTNPQEGDKPKRKVRTKVNESSNVSFEKALEEITKANTTEQLMDIYSKYKDFQHDKNFVSYLTNRKNEIKNNGNTKA